MHILTPLATAVTLAGFAGAAHADRMTDRFVYRIQSDAAFDGIEVSRIQLRGAQVLVHGEDRQGRQVVLRRQCGQDRLECPPVRMAAQEPSPARPSIMSLGAGVRPYQTGR